MSTPSPPARAYRRLGYLALAHAATLVALTALMLHNSELVWLRRLWVGLVTLWFFWPVVLVLHSGRSALRLGLLALLSAVLLWPSLRFYNTLAPDALGLPDGLRMDPLSAGIYFNAYLAGRAEAQKDVAAGILAIEEYGFGAGFGPGVDLLCDRYQIEVRPIAGCVVDERILGHASGYNAVSEREIDRRVGSENVRATREEGYRLAVEHSERLEQYFKELAHRLSSFSSDSKITLEPVQLWTEPQREIDAEAERELGQLVHAVEKFVVEAIPADGPAFEFRVSGTLTPTATPRFEVASASLSCPRPVYEKIYGDLPNLPLPQWSRAELFVALDYKVGATK